MWRKICLQYCSFFNRIGVIAKKFADVADQKEKWYGTEYKLEDIADEKIQVSNVNSWVRLFETICSDSAIVMKFNNIFCLVYRNGRIVDWVRIFIFHPEMSLFQQILKFFPEKKM